MDGSGYTPVGSALMDRETKIFSRGDSYWNSIQFRQSDAGTGNRVAVLYSADHTQGRTGTLNLASKQGSWFAPQDIGFLQQVAAQVAVALDNARAYREIAQLTEKLASEKLYLEEEIRTELNFEEIVGEARL